jgi:hydroxyacylglutathione hydrolase
MILKRLYDEKLAQASYLIGCERTHLALVVDPKRDVEFYLDAARTERLTIAHVTETHIHADFVSGSRELAARTGAKLYLSGEGGRDWQYSWASEAGAEILSDGSKITVGDVQLEARHTPGHTPEHLTFLVTDTAHASEPMGALTGDFIFVGDVGRPDLLERAAGVAGTKEAAARVLFASLREFKKLPDYLQIWPGHGAGSACGKELGSMPQSTLGYEGLFNWALLETNENRFVEQVLEGQSDPPAYFAVMKRVNRDGSMTDAIAAPIPLKPAAMKKLYADPASVVVDTRTPAEFGREHLAGSLNIPHNKSFLKWAGALVPYDADVHLVIPGGLGEAAPVLKELSLIGLDRIAGVFSAEQIPEAARVGAPTSTVTQLPVGRLTDPDTRNGMLVLDVRNADEWSSGHIPGAVHIPLGSLPRRVAELPPNRAIAVHCQGGTRSAIASSILKKSGRADISNVSGGFSEWERGGNPIARGER